MFHKSWLPLLAAIFIAFVPAVRAQDDKIFRELTPDATEKLLKDQKIEFAKTSSKKMDEHYYDFTRNNFKIRLTHVSPKELMIDCVFRGIPIEKVNHYNTITRVARASLHRDNSGSFSLLEYGLDISGGISASTFKQFLARFDEELKNYDRFVAESVAADTVLTEVTDKQIESILKTEGIDFTKKTNPSGVTMFDFAVKHHKLRMYNFGGKDLMIDAHFKKLPATAANSYNLSRKYIRVVNYKGKDVEYTALECNLDCEGGVTEGAVRVWIRAFAEDVEHFATYTKKVQDLEKAN
ncbi:MAG TPA: hypothetical protein VFE62_03865 [Gemmataceae bacterium]|nr:hypothetical protein [Gemmataceae bacterium]